jgi:hypothetical protein
MEVFGRLTRRPFCWLFGHHVGPAVVRRLQEKGRSFEARIASCTRCGHAFAGELRA